MIYKMKSSLEKIKNNKKETLLSVAILVILIIGMLIRIVEIADMPNALNCDEASAGYEAFSILNYGIDRNRKQIAGVFSRLGRRTKCVTFVFNYTIY